MRLGAEDRELIARDVEAYLDHYQKRDLLRLLTAGSVDDGKSTLIGRLLYDTQAVYDDHMSAVERDSRKHGTTGTAADLALLTDGLRAEREQGITIDVAYRFFATSKRKFIIADTPGHEQYTRNMATGASTADLAVILVDARHGVLAQTRRHSFIASLLGIRHLVVAVNKMDLVGWSEQRFGEIRAEYADFAARLNVPDVHFIPLSALQGDNVVTKGAHTPWYHGPALLGYLEEVHIASDRNMIDLRFPVQFVNRPNLDFRGFAGTLASGVVRTGEEVMALPSGRRTKVARIVGPRGDLPEAFAGQAVTLCLADEIDVSRGDMLVHPRNLPSMERGLEAIVVWMHDAPLVEGRTYVVKCGTQTVSAEVAQVEYRFDVNTVHRAEPSRFDGRAGLGLNEIGRVVLETARPVLFDAYAKNRRTGCFVVIDRMTNVTVGAGMLVDRKPVRTESALRSRDAARSELPDRVRSRVTGGDRAAKLGHAPLTVWLTGLPRSGKTTVALLAEKMLADRGIAAAALDGVTLRFGLNRDLGYSADERAEATRRAAEAARLMNDAGLVVIASLVSPYRADRDAARRIVGDDRFVEAWAKAPLDVCEARDAALHPDGAGLYARARRGEVRSFTGVTAPYEEPEAPGLVLDTSARSAEECARAVVEAVVVRVSRPAV
ncbi:MAG: Bifunctional enzyme CysN/CysC [Planctomycetes bacterium]|nr:Bifunctional enzyme CysN/CysC [Planctomycetota bacterium]